MSVEMTLSRETLCFERLALAREEQVSVEGEATLPGSMRDAVTVLSVQAQAYLEDARATAGGMTLRGHVSFQALYTQGDLTRIRAMETTCDFEHSIDAPELQPDMRVNASVAVQETEGTAASGRMTLRALLDLQIEAFEMTRQALVTDAAGDADALRTRMQRVAFCRTAPLGEEKTLVREEFAGLRPMACANLPYYITTPVLFRLLESGLPVERICVMLQKEAVQRVMAQQGDKEYGPLAIQCAYRADIDRVMSVPPHSFIPQPHVDSEVIALDLRPYPVQVEERAFMKLVKSCFAMRRKTLVNNLMSYGLSRPQAQSAVEEAGLAPAVRAETLSLDDFLNLFEKIRSQTV